MVLMMLDIDRSTDSPASVPPAQVFLQHADRLVDTIYNDYDRHRQGSSLDILAYLKQRHPSPVPPSRIIRPKAFRRAPDIYLGNLRFGRLRLFLSGWIGDWAWHLWRLA